MVLELKLKQHRMRNTLLDTNRHHVSVEEHHDEEQTQPRVAVA